MTITPGVGPFRNKVCSVKGCEKRTHAKGRCQYHYYKWWTEVRRRESKTKPKAA
jgi:hypothetical protein